MSIEAPREGLKKIWMEKSAIIGEGGRGRGVQHLMAKVIKISIFLLELFPNEGYVAWRESKCRPGCANFANAKP